MAALATRSRLVALRLVLLAFIVTTATAEAASPWTVAAHEQPATGASVVADDERYAAFGGESGSALVFDDRAPAAGFRRVAFDSTCRFDQAVGAGQLGVRCVATDAYRFDQWNGTIDIASGTLSQRVDPPTDSGEANSHVLGIGRRWLQVQVDGYRYQYRSYYSRDGGAPVHVRDAKRTAPNLDTARPVPKLCAPVRRARLGRRGFHPAVRAGRWVVTTRPGRLLAWRCGRRFPKVIARCACSPTVGAGYVSFQRDGRVRLYRLRDGARRSIRSPDARAIVTHTRDFLLASFPALDGTTVVRARRPAW